MPLSEIRVSVFKTSNVPRLAIVSFNMPIDQQCPTISLWVFTVVVLLVTRKTVENNMDGKESEITL